MTDENGQWLLSRRSEANGTALAVALHYSDLVEQLLWHILSGNSSVTSFVLKQGRKPHFCPCFAVLLDHVMDCHYLAQTIRRLQSLGYKDLARLK